SNGADKRRHFAAVGLGIDGFLELPVVSRLLSFEFLRVFGNLHAVDIVWFELQELLIANVRSSFGERLRPVTSCQKDIVAIRELCVIVCLFGILTAEENLERLAVFQFFSLLHVRFLSSK